MYCRKWAAMLCGEMQKYVEKTPDLYFQFRNGGNYSLKEKLPTLLADPQSSRSFVSAFSAVATQA
jgi:hypothetical protein